MKITTKQTKGELTRRRILDAAKELFYENGFNATPVQAIAKRADSTLGGMTYHFSTKEEIIALIGKEYIDKLYELILDSDVKDESWLFLHFVVSFNFYNQLTIDDNMIRYHTELLHGDRSSYETNYLTYQKVYYKFVDEAHIRFPKSIIEAKIMADFGARREFEIQYLKGNINMTRNEASIFLLSNTAHILTIPDKIVKDTAQRALEYYLKNPYDHIKMLI